MGKTLFSLLNIHQPTGLISAGLLSPAVRPPDEKAIPQKKKKRIGFDALRSPPPPFRPATAKTSTVAAGCCSAVGSLLPAAAVTNSRPSGVGESALHILPRRPSPPDIFRSCRGCKGICGWTIFSPAQVSFSISVWTRAKNGSGFQESRSIKLELVNVPGGAFTFAVAAKFCYGSNFEITTAKT